MPISEPLPIFTYGNPGAPTYSVSKPTLFGIMEVLPDNLEFEITAQDVRDVILTVWHLGLSASQAGTSGSSGSSGMNGSSGSSGITGSSGSSGSSGVSGIGMYSVETVEKRDDYVNYTPNRYWGMLVTVYNDIDPLKNGIYQLQYNLNSTNLNDNLNWKYINKQSTWLNSALSFTSSPPPSPNIGDRYIIGTGSGDWFGLDNNIAEFSVSTWTQSDWIYLIPVDDNSIMVDNTPYVFDGSNWISMISNTLPSKYYITEDVTILPDYQYFIHGDLTVDGSTIDNYGEIVILNGILVCINGGTVSMIGGGGSGDRNGTLNEVSLIGNGSKSSSTDPGYKGELSYDISTETMFQCVQTGSGGSAQWIGWSVSSV